MSTSQLLGKQKSDDDNRIIDASIDLIESFENDVIPDTAQCQVVPVDPTLFFISDQHAQKAKFDLSLSPEITALCKKDGSPCEGNKRTNVETSAVVEPSNQARRVWNNSAVIVRELLQNASDACIRCLEPHTEYNWHAQDTDNGVALYLNHGLAAEVYIHHDAKEKSVTLMVYNRGCIMPIDAFEVGSHKLPSFTDGYRLDRRKQDYIAGGHGIGLKDVITTAFSILGYSELNVSTYHPHNDYRTFRMSKSKLKCDKAMSEYKGKYTMNVTDTDSAPMRGFPMEAKSVLRALKSEGGTAGTLVAFKKVFRSSESLPDQLKMKDNLMAALKKHIFSTSSNTIKKRILVKDESGHFLGYFLLMNEASSVLKTYLYPGLFYCSKRIDREKAPERRLAVVFSSVLIYTNRDRTDVFENQAELALGRMLFVAVLAREATVLQLVTVALKCSLSSGDQMMGYGSEPVLVTALIKYHRSLEAPDLRRQGIVLDTLRDLCFGDVTVVSDAETFQILNALSTVEEWPLACPRPMRPFLINGKTQAKDYLELHSSALTDALNLAKKFMAASTMLTPSLGKALVLPFPKLFKPMHDAGYRFLNVSSRVPVGIFGSKDHMIDDKVVYITSDLQQRLHDPSVARQLFSSFMRELVDLTQQVLRSFTEEATTATVIISQQPKNQQPQDDSEPAAKSDISRLKAGRTTIASRPAKVTSQRTVYPVTPSAKATSPALDSSSHSDHESTSPHSDDDYDYFDDFDVDIEEPAIDSSDGDCDNSSSPDAVMVSKRKLGDLVSSLDGLKKKVKMLLGR